VYLWKCCLFVPWFGCRYICRLLHHSQMDWSQYPYCMLNILCSEAYLFLHCMSPSRTEIFLSSNGCTGCDWKKVYFSQLDNVMKRSTSCCLLSDSSWNKLISFSPTIVISLLFFLFYSNSCVSLDTLSVFMWVFVHVFVSCWCNVSLRTFFMELFCSETFITVVCIILRFSSVHVSIPFLNKLHTV
jgi:hypothetical protein